MVAYITDAPTYPGFTARAGLCQHATIFSVEMDEEGAKPDEFERQIKKARELGHYVPFYYTVPDGHNPLDFRFLKVEDNNCLTLHVSKTYLSLKMLPTCT